MSEHLKKITARAKKIRAAHPSMKWTNAIKQASKELRPAGTPRTRKTKTRQPATRKKTAQLQDNKDLNNIVNLHFVKHAVKIMINLILKHGRREGDGIVASLYFTPTEIEQFKIFAAKK